MTKTRENPQKSNEFYKRYYNSFIIALIVMIGLLLIGVFLLLYQVHHRPLPQFQAVSPQGQQMLLLPNDEPNLLSTTLIKWATKAAVTAYTFDFVNAAAQLSAAKPYFTDQGWTGYQTSIQNLLSNISQNQLFVTGVVSGTPVISNQGDLFGHFAWRIQLPFLVSYQGAETTEQKNYRVTLTIVKVPTTTNPAGIGIDQFVMK